MFLPILVLVISGFLGAVSQVILKKAAMRTYRSGIWEYLNAYVVSAYAIFFATTLMSVYAYKTVPLSLGSLLEALNYLYITFFGVIIFKENLNRRKIPGLILIIAGVLLYSI